MISRPELQAPANNPSPGAVVLPPELRFFARVAIALTTLAWITAAISALVGKGYPYTWPLAPRGTSLYDYWIYFELFHKLHTQAFFSRTVFPFTYSAPGAVVYQLLYLFGLRGGAAVYLALVIATVVGGCIWLRRALVRAGLQPAAATRFLLISAITSYPILFGAERGNLELLLAAGLALGLAAYCRRRLFVAAVLWGAFGSVKLYPLLLLALFVSHRQYRALLVSCATAAITTLLSLWYIGPSIRSAQAGIQHGTHAFISMCALTYASFSWDHSLYTIPKLVLYPMGVNRHYLLLSYALVAGGAMLVLYVMRIRHLPLANQIVILLVSTVLLPPTSFDYTLVQLYGAWAVLAFVAVRSAVRGGRVRGLTAGMVLLAIVFTPLNLLGLGQGHSYGGPAKSLVLLALLILATRTPYTQTAGVKGMGEARLEKPDAEVAPRP